MSILLRDVIDIDIDIGEQAGAQDYVLRLTDSVTGDAVAGTLDDYVVTPDLADAFGTALGLVAASIWSFLNDHRGDEVTVEWRVTG